MSSKLDGTWENSLPRRIICDIVESLTLLDPVHWMPVATHQIFMTTTNVPSWDFLVGQTAKNLPVMWETQVQSLGDPLEKGMATHSNILAWRIPWTEDPGGLQSTGSQRVVHDWQTNVLSSYNHFLNYFGFIFVGLFLFLCFLPREVPLAFVVRLVWWWQMLLTFAYL